MLLDEAVYGGLEIDIFGHAPHQTVCAGKASAAGEDQTEGRGINRRDRR
jgi:hypothetical protein